MAEAVVLQEAPAERGRGTERAPLLGIALVSFGALLLELALTRLFSVVLFYHFAFLAISIALLGLGGGGVLAYVTRGKLGNLSTRELAVRLCAANAVLVVVVLWIVLHSEIGLSLDWKNFARLTAMYLASGLPFLFTGALFSVVFARETARVGQLYGADLLGGAVACLLVVPLLNWVGAPNVVLLVAVAMAVAAAVWSPNAKARWAVLALAVVVGSVVVVNHSGRLFDIIYAKGSRRDEPWVDFVRWNAISRIEVDKQGNSLAIVIDADASTYVMGVDPRKVDDSKWKQPLMAAPSAVVNVLRPHGTYAIIGPGGGVDVLRAVVSGSPSVTGIEINPIIATTIMRQRYAGLAHHLYDLPEVHIHVSDGRSWVRSSREQFDVLQMTLVDTWASTAAGAFALSENNLYTVQAFKEYFEHLKPDGIIAITRWEFKEPREALRVVSQGMQALYDLGTRGDLKTHFLVISDGPLDVDGRPVTVLAKKSPFTAEEEQQALAHIAANHNLRALYLPSAAELGGAKLGPTGGLVYPATADAFTYLIQSNNPLHFARGYAYNVAPVYDNNPFFFFTLKPQQVLHRVFGAADEGLDWKVNLGIAVLGIVLILSVVAVLALLVLPLAIYAPARRQSAWRLFYFVAVGLGYILVEIAFIQRFVLFLGHPVYALTVVVFLMLLASGAGSVASRHWLADTGKLRRPLLVIVPAIAALVWALPQVLTGLVGLPFVIKLALSAVLLVPLGFFMGMPFPTGLRAMARAAEGGSQPDENGIEWAWAMNAAASVLGSVLAISIAIVSGLSVTLACGAVAYLLALALARSLTASAA